MTTSVRHLNCGTMRPPLARIRGLAPARLVDHVLLIEGADGLTLVDSGFGAADVLERGGRLGRAFMLGVGPVLDAGETAVAQLRALGHDPRDVRDIVLTHLDLDHAGGLGDFPHARVHVHATELFAAARPTLRERPRYVRAQWAHGPDWVEHVPGGETWFGFESVQAVKEDVLLIPLHGHTRGHSGVAVRRPGGGWFLDAGDAYFDAGDLTRPRSCPPGLRAYQAALAVDNAARRANLERLQELHAAHSDEITIFSAHSASEFDALSSSSS
jgi:glyoxylase-like metal-dependent hydrolase (beta-lactamase superfamily II)